MTILQALHAALQTIPAAVLHASVLPERVPPGGVLILRDGDPGQSEVTLAPVRHHYEQRVEVEAFVDGTRPNGTPPSMSWPGPAGRRSHKDRKLGGLCDWVEAQAPSWSDLPVEVAAELIGAHQVAKLAARVLSAQAKAIRGRARPSQGTTMAAPQGEVPARCHRERFGCHGSS